MRHNHFFIAILIGLLTLASIGCSDPDARFAMVEGTITYNGQPVENATVTFLPVDPSGEIAVGLTDASGRFTLGSTAAVRVGTGAIPGEYTVLVVARQAQHDPNAATRLRYNEAYERGEITYDRLDERLRAIPGPPAPINLVPARYGNPRDTDLRATVERVRVNTFTFDLVD